MRVREIRKLNDKVIDMSTYSAICKSRSIVEFGILGDHPTTKDCLWFRAETKDGEIFDFALEL